MATNNSHETPSPSASSLFLPLGRRMSRRDSRASIATEVDKETLTEALNQIHTAASQSDTLTVFNEYTAPPSGVVSNDSKGITSELQGGISGLYNRFRSSVAGAKDLSPGLSKVPEASSGQVLRDDTSTRSSNQSTPSFRPLSDGNRLPQNDTITSVPSSGQPSRLHSPTLVSFEAAGAGNLIHGRPSAKLSTKPLTQSSKSSVPSTPALKSPVGALKTQSGATDPTVSEVSVVALKDNSKNGAKFDQQSTAGREDQTAENEKTLRVPSQSSKQGPDFPDHQLPSPKMSDGIFQETRKRDARSLHEREGSFHSIHLPEPVSSQYSRSSTTVDVSADSCSKLSESQTLARSSTRESSGPPSKSQNPLRLMTNEASLKQMAAQNVPTESSGSVASSGFPAFNNNPAVIVKRPTDRLTPRVSQSRLPGFARTASSDSMATSQIASSHIRFNNAGKDGPTDSAAEAVSTPKIIVNKLRSKLLSKEFWMRDENAKDCFRCQEQFTTFRRKHHCRTCGQIFDSKCTRLLPGDYFGINSTVRVCLPCEAMVTAHDSDSSDYSVDDAASPSPMANFRPHTPISEQQLKHDHVLEDDDAASIVSQPLDHMTKTPTMGIPVRRAIDSSNRRSAILEFDSDRPLPRPSSSRSLRTSHSIGHGHRRNHSKHQHIRSFKSYHEERAPFQRRIGEEQEDETGKPAFHRDSITDLDYNQDVSENSTSEDEPSNIFSTMESRLSKSTPDTEKAAFGGLLAATKKARYRSVDRHGGSLLNPHRDADEISINSSRAVNLPRAGRRRNLSVASSVHQYLSPRSVREPHILNPSQHGTPSPLISPAQNPLPGKSRLTRSASMRGEGAPAVELNRASLQHVRKLLRQQLQDAGIPKVNSWETALMPILLKATDEVDPDVQHGDDLDIRHYVKLKKIPGGRPGDTAYVSGLVFTKNLALKSMPRSILRPNILIVTFPLEYARHEQHFMSLAPVIRQEREYLENLVNRIAALGPHLLLAQKNISGLALQLLEKANIATAYNVKASVLEAVSRCSQTRIITSMDKLVARPAHTGTCESFDVKTYVFNGRKRTYIFVSGCLPQLGCTIALRGAERDILAKIKRITEFMVYVVYNLKLETCLMRDEFALIPSIADDGSVASQKDSRGAAVLQQTSISAVNQRLQDQNQNHEDQSKSPSSDNAFSQKAQSSNPPIRLESNDSSEIPDDIPVPTFYEDMVEKHQTKILSASPFVKFMQPYLLMRARELERRVAYLKRLRDQDISIDPAVEDKSKGQKFTLIQPEMVHASLSGASKKVREILHAVHDSEYDKALHNYETQKRQWETYLSGNRNLFDPYSHQNIVVLYSQVCTTTSVPCFGPELLGLAFYDEHESTDQFVPDSTLGQYVEDLCYGANNLCTANGCERKMYEHHRQYVHGGAQVSVFVIPYPSKMRGMQETILMWSQCKICGNETPVIPMSNSTWKYSFGKYLELSFWSADLHARAGICPHDLHRDHLRYFGFNDFALRFHYDSINLLEIIVPRMRITWKVENTLKFRNEVYTKLEHRINRFMLSIKARIKTINSEAVLPELAGTCQQEIEKLAKRANEEHIHLIRQLQDRYINSRHWETIPLNRAMRLTQEKVAEWDTTFTEFEKNFFPSEKDIRRLATLQLKKIFLDRDVSVTSLTSNEDSATVHSQDTHDFVTEKIGADGIVCDDTDPAAAKPRRMTQLSPEKTQNVLQSVVEEHSGNPLSELTPVAESGPGLSLESTLNASIPPTKATPEDVQHLDLAMTAGLQKQSSRDSDSKSPSLTPTIPKTSSTPYDHLQLADGTASVPDAARVNEAKEAAVENKAASQRDNPPRSAIPRLLDSSARGPGIGSTSGPSPPRPSPPLIRAQSQPANSPSLRREKAWSESADAVSPPLPGFGSGPIKPTISPSLPSTEGHQKTSEKKFSNRFGLGHLKHGKLSKGHSLIPRSVAGHRNSRVTNLAKHFEQLSREFEKERIRERRQRAANSRHSRVYPLASSKPIVEVYKNVHEAVEEKDASEECFAHSNEPADSLESRLSKAGESAGTVDGMARTNATDDSSDPLTFEDTAAETTEGEPETMETSKTQSDTEEDHTDNETSLLDDIEIPESPEDLVKMSAEDIDLKELPKNERTSLMRMLTTFWAERSASGWMALEYPLTASDHIFADSDIIVREDEPSSLIAFALDSDDYNSKLWSIQEHSEMQTPLPVDPDSPLEENQADVMHSLLRATGTHLKYQFQEGPAKMLCKIFFAEQFDAVRRKCGVSDRIVESLSRCAKWDSKGGKTKSLFLKTLDDRFVLKSLSPIETQAFLKFAPAYFQIMSEAFFHELPSVIAKMLGFYQIIIKNPVTGMECNWFLLVMENLFYDRTPTRIFDLKGSMRNRKIHSTGATNEVLLDENMVDFIYESPLFAREHSKKLLRGSVHNDTLFLARQNVMDYSLMIAIDEVRKELVVGIIDCIRTYTWDKKLESWIKERGLGGGGGGRNRPTVTSPKEYKKRFREAMGRYVLEAPNCWHQFRASSALEKQRSLLMGDSEDREKDVFTERKSGEDNGVIGES
ncbi:MAG: hypothetical protein Q9227_004877 [Pyrenula ochraceoflavens]